MKNNAGRMKKALYSSVTSALYQVIVIICGFITSKLIITTYGSSWNGVITSVTKYLSLFTIIEVGINGSTRVALYKSFADNDNKKTSAIIRANDLFYRKVSAFLVVYVAVIAIVLPYIVKSDKDRLLISLMVVIIGLGNFAENCWGINSKILLMASQNRYIINIAQTLATIANAIALVLIVHFGGSIFVSKAGSSIVHTIVPIALFIISRRMFKIDRHVEPDNSALKGRWDVLANSLSNMIHENVDVFFLTIFCASTELSVYHVYYVVAGGLTKVFQVIINGIEAGFGSMWMRGEMDTLKKNLRRFEYIMYSMAVLLFGSMIVLIVPFMSVYMRNITDVNYQRYILGLCIGIAQILMSIRTPYVLLVQAAGHYKQVKVGAFLEAGINIVLTWILIVKFGIVGAIIGTIIANAFRTIQYGWYSSKHMIDRSFMEIVRRFVWMTACLLLSIASSQLVIMYLSVSGWITWIVAAAIVFAIHACVVLVGSLIFYKQDLLECFSMLKRIIRRK